MASAREYTASPLQLSAAFFDDYLDHRSTYWESTTQKAISIVSSRSMKRKEVCDDFINRIPKLDAFEKKIKIIFELGKQARAAQSEKMQSESESFWASTVNYALSYFVKDNSLFSKECHAVRTCLIDLILNSDDKKKYDDYILLLRKELEDKRIELKKAIREKVEIQKIVEERNELLYRLLDLCDEETIVETCEREQFPPALPHYDVKKIKLGIDYNFNFDPNIPLVYDKNYFTFFYLIDIHSDPKRNEKFLQFLAKRASSEEVIQPNLLRGNFLIRLNDKLPNLIQKNITELTCKIKCGFLLTSIKPEAEALDQLPSTANNLYVLTNEHLFYIDKAQKLFTKIDIETLKLSELKNALELDKVSLKEKDPYVIAEMNGEQLRQIIQITGHEPGKETSLKQEVSVTAFGIYNKKEDSPKEEKQTPKPHVAPAKKKGNN